MSEKETKVVISYSHEDEEDKKFVVSHLRVLQREGLLEVWSDRDINAGAEWQGEIASALADADIAILLISRHFLDSDFIVKEEVPTLLKRLEKQDGLRLIPILLSDCAWKEVQWLKSLNILPLDGKPLNTFSEHERNKIMTQVADDIITSIRSNSKGLSKTSANISNSGTGQVESTGSSDSDKAKDQVEDDPSSPNVERPFPQGDGDESHKYEANNYTSDNENNERPATGKTFFDDFRFLRTSRSFLFTGSVLSIIVGFLSGIFFYTTIWDSRPYILTPSRADTDQGLTSEQFKNGGKFPNGILADVLEQKKLICGVNGDLPGFSDEENTGLDADYCRVLATTIFGPDYSDEQLEFRQLNATQRWNALKNGDIHVLFRNTSFTIGREVDYKIRFGPPIFYDEQSFLVLEDSKMESFEDLFSDTKRKALRDLAKTDKVQEKDRLPNDMTVICLAKDTTHETNFYNHLHEKEISKDDYKIETEPIELGDEEVLDNTERRQLRRDKVAQALLKYKCDAITADSLYLKTVPYGTNYDLSVFKTGISREILSPAYLDGDVQWDRIVRYAIYATLEAAILDVSKNNIGTDNGDPLVKRFLSDHSKKMAAHMGLSNRLSFIHDIIKNLGNYHDIYSNRIGKVFEGIEGIKILDCNTTSQQFTYKINLDLHCGPVTSPPLIWDTDKNFSDRE